MSQRTLRTDLTRINHALAPVYGIASLGVFFIGAVMIFTALSWMFD